MAIIISKNGKDAKKIEKSSFEKEHHLQEYVSDNPETIPLYDISEDIHVLILARELQTASGPIDALGIDKNGEIYVIETKFYKNPDKRQVVAQALDYGASLWSHTDFDELVRTIEAQVSKKFGVSLPKKLEDFFGITTPDVPILMDAIKRNLNEGSIKFVILMDHLHPQLKDLIVFINQNSQFDIYAVELEYYKYENYEIVIPKIFGAEVKKDIGVSSSRKQWDEASFFEDAKRRLGSNELKAVEGLYAFSKKTADKLSWGTGSERGSFNSKFTEVSVKSLYSVFSDGILQINFAWLNDSKSAEKARDRLGEELSAIRELGVPKGYATTYINIPAAKWCPHVEKVIAAIKWVLSG